MLRVLRRVLLLAFEFWDYNVLQTVHGQNRIDQDNPNVKYAYVGFKEKQKDDVAAVKERVPLQFSYPVHYGRILFVIS